VGLSSTRKYAGVCNYLWTGRGACSSLIHTRPTNIATWPSASATGDGRQSPTRAIGSLSAHCKSPARGEQEGAVWWTVLTIFSRARGEEERAVGWTGIVATGAKLNRYHGTTVLCDLVGGQNGPKKSWTKILAETLAPLLLGID
jgi:hypothetical protein